LQKVKRGELRAVLTRTGRRKCLCIEIPASQDSLFWLPGTISKGPVHVTSTARPAAPCPRDGCRLTTGPAKGAGTR
jgi:hypothetical protein